MIPVRRIAKTSVLVARLAFLLAASAAAAPLAGERPARLPASAILTNSLRALTGLPKTDAAQMRQVEQALGKLGLRVAMTNDAVLLLARLEAAKFDPDLRARLIEDAGGPKEGPKELARREGLARGLVAEWQGLAGSATGTLPPAAAALDRLVARLTAASEAGQQAEALAIFADGSALHASLNSAAPPAVSPAAPLPEIKASKRATAGYKDDASARGQTVLLVGAKPAILKEARRVADELGFRLLLADDPRARKKSKELIPEADFIPVPGMDKHDRESLHLIAETVARATEKIGVDRVITFTNAHLLAAGRIRDRIDALGVPRQAIERAYDKGRARRLFNRPPMPLVRFARVDSVAEARRFFEESGGGPQRRFVMKANRGDNGSFVLLDIKSAKEAENAYRKLMKSLRAAAKSGEAGIFDVHPGILMEEMLVKKPKGHEVSVEVVMQNGEAAVAEVSDTVNFGPRRAFPGGSMNFPTVQTTEEQAFIETAVMAARALGIENGNARVDIIPTAEGPRVIEVNARMGGASIWKVVELLRGVNLVEQGLRAVLGLRVDPGHKPREKIVYSFVSSRFTGTIEAVKGLEEALKVPGVRQLKMTVEAGDKVTAAEGGAFQDIGDVIVSASTHAEAKARTLQALRLIKIGVRQKSGKLVWQTADFMHTLTDD